MFSSDPTSEIGLFLVLPRTARIIPPRPSCICSLGAPSLQWLYWKWLEEYDGDRSSSGDLAQGFGNMEFFRPGRDISENHLLMTRISKSCVVTWIIKVRARTQIWCSGSGVIFLHESGSMLLTGLCVYTHYPSKCFWKQNLLSVRSISRDLVWWRNGGCHAVKSNLMLIYGKSVVSTPRRQWKYYWYLARTLFLLCSPFWLSHVSTRFRRK